MAEEHRTISQKLDRIRNFLKIYDQRVGIGELVPRNEVNRYLVMEQQELRKLPPIECGEASVLLCQEAAFLQNELNKHQAIVEWCERSITKVIASSISNVGDKWLPYEYRRELSINQNDIATELDVVLRKEKLRVDALQYMANAFRSLSSAFEQLQQTKRSMKI